MHITRNQYVRTVAGVCALAAAVRAGNAQTRSELSAYNALIVSPVGALPPTAVDEGRAIPDKASVAVSYGQWRFDIDDAIHHNVGLTLTHRLGGSHTSISATGAYLSSSCACPDGYSGGVSSRTILWWNAAGARPDRISASEHIALEVWGSGARYQGAGHPNAASFAVDADLGGSIPLTRSSRLALAAFPGVGWGHYNSADETGEGIRPIYGVGLSWKFEQGVSIDFGARRIVLKDGPTELGAGVSWRKL
jgi:hypothetical protein